MCTWTLKHVTRTQRLSCPFLYFAQKTSHRSSFGAWPSSLKFRGRWLGWFASHHSEQLQMEYETSPFLRTFGHSPLGRSYGPHHLIEQPCPPFILLSSLSLPTFSTISFFSHPFSSLGTQKFPCPIMQSNLSLSSSYSQTPGPSLQI